MNNSIAKEYNFISLLKFALPSIIMMIFTSLYTMMDGIFVSKFVGTAALSAVNIVYPLYNVIIAIGVMFATGASALIAKKMGEGNYKSAQESFSLIVYISIIIGVFILGLGVAFMSPILKMLGANENIFSLCFDYATTLIIFAPLTLLQLLFQYFFITAGKPAIGLTLTIIGGCINTLLDYLFIVPLNMGVVGAALATGIGLSFPAIFGLIYFAINRKCSLHLVKPKFDFKVIVQSCANGSSEMVSNIALAIVTFLFNIIMMNMLGEDGVAAITIMLYMQFFLNALYLGFSMGVAPIISYNYGSQNIPQTKKIFKYCISFTVYTSLIACISSILLTPSIITFFAPRGSSVYNIAMGGLYLFNLNYLFAGLNIFTSSMFTAFSNGKVSAIISFMRTFVFIVLGLLLLPLILGVNGVWISMTVAEFLAVIVSTIYIITLNKKYHYFA